MQRKTDGKFLSSACSLGTGRRRVKIADKDRWSDDITQALTLPPEMADSLKDDDTIELNLIIA